jgi:ribonuclease HI
MGKIAGGAAVIVESSTVYYASVNGDIQSNNRGELYGIILGLMYTKGSVIIHTDSQYSINILSNGYTPKENFDLITEATNLMKGRIVRLEYVPAHVGIVLNELADVYAKKACSTVRGTVLNESF